MPSISSWLSDVSRKKLRVAASGHDGLRDTISLRRFVLLKNSITQAESPPLASNTTHRHPSSTLMSSNDKSVEVPLFPHTRSSSSHDSEEKWLESVLETLGDDFDGQVEVEVHPVEDDDDLDSLPSPSDDPYASWVSSFDGFVLDDDLPISANNFLSSQSPVLSTPFHAPPSIQLLFNSPTSQFHQPFVEPRYPEADFDLPNSESSSDSESDDDDGPLTPYSGSQPSLERRRGVEPEVYVGSNSYFLYPSELDTVSTPNYYQQC